MICHETPGGAVAMRFHVSVWRLDNGLACTDVLPDEVSEAISNAVRRGMTSGAKEYLRRYRGSDAVTPEVYLWTLVD